MPLIIVTGLPCSGKTYRAQQIASALSSFIASDPSTSKRSVRVISSHHAQLDTTFDTTDKNPAANLRDQIYNNPAQEKTARAEDFSTVKREVSKDVIVIADSLNYIKGYRYQLWCEAKAAGTRCCVIHVAAQENECEQWNRERLRAWGLAEGEENGILQTPEPVKVGAKVGRNVLGDLVPESHTAIYGDRVVERRSASPSSSLDGEDGEGREPGHKQAEDTMTLKSLYIHDRPDKSTTSSQKIVPEIQSTYSVNEWQSITDSTPTSPPLPQQTPPYTPSTLKSLMMRYEPPSPFSRWDTPLFTIPSTDLHPPYEQIWNALYPAPPKLSAKKQSHMRHHTSKHNSQPEHLGASTTLTSQPEPTVKQHAATILPRATSVDALQTLETATMDVTKLLLARARDLGVADTGEGGTITFPISISSPQRTTDDDETLEVELGLPTGVILSQPSLQRSRRKYTQIQRGSIAHGQGHVSERGRRGVIEGFVRFLEGEWEG